jgi:FkbM family methyltransferase
LAFSKWVPKSVQDLSPIKGYELYRKLREGDYVIDCGAYPGDYAVYAAKKVGPKGKVIAFEPDPNNREILIRNIKAEGLKNVLIIPKAVGARDGAKIQMVSDGLHSFNLNQSISYDPDDYIEVCTIDAELKRQGINKIDVIKMDIEGEEVNALRGCRETLKKNNIYVTVATYHKWPEQPFFLTTMPVRQILGECGYHTLVDFEKHLTTYGKKLNN